MKTWRIGLALLALWGASAALAAPFEVAINPSRFELAGKSAGTIRDSLSLTLTYIGRIFTGSTGFQAKPRASSRKRVFPESRTVSVTGPSRSLSQSMCSMKSSIWSRNAGRVKLRPSLREPCV